MSNKTTFHGPVTMDRKNKHYAELLDHIIKVSIEKKLAGPELDRSTSIASFQVSDKFGATFLHVHVACRLTSEPLEKTQTAAMVSGSADG